MNFKENLKQESARAQHTLNCMYLGQTEEECFGLFDILFEARTLFQALLLGVKLSDDLNSVDKLASDVKWTFAFNMERSTKCLLDPKDERLSLGAEDGDDVREFLAFLSAGLKLEKLGNYTDPVSLLKKLVLVSRLKQAARCLKEFRDPESNRQHSEFNFRFCLETYAILGNDPTYGFETTLQELGQTNVTIEYVRKYRQAHLRNMLSDRKTKGTPELLELQILNEAMEQRWRTAENLSKPVTNRDLRTALDRYREMYVKYARDVVSGASSLELLVSEGLEITLGEVLKALMFSGSTESLGLTPRCLTPGPESLLARLTKRILLSWASSRQSDPKFELNYETPEQLRAILEASGVDRAASGLSEADWNAAAEE